MPTRRGGVLKPMLIAVLVIVAIGVLWLCVEIYFAVTATPDVDTDYAAQMEELAASVQAEGPNRWGDYASLLAQHSSMMERLSVEILAIEPVDSSLYLSIDAIYDADSYRDEVTENLALSESERIAELARIDAAAAAYVGALNSQDARGFLDRLRSLRVSDAFVGRKLPRDIMLIEVMLPELRGARDMARTLRARMHLAAESGDWEEYVATVADGLWLSETVAADPILICGLVGVSVRALVLEGVRGDLTARRIPAEALAGLGEAIASVSAFDMSHHLRGELLWGLDAVQHTHDSRGRLIVSRLNDLEGGGETLPPIVNMASVVLPRRGTTERAFRDHYSRLIAFAELSPAEQRARYPDPRQSEIETPGNQPLLAVMAPAVAKGVQAYNASAIDRLGVITMVAVERHRADAGRLPAALDDLVPSYLGEVPMDPWADGQPLRYMLDDSDLGYVLYSVGRDGTDNGGTRPPESRARNRDQGALNGDAPGTDYVLTRASE